MAKNTQSLASTARSKSPVPRHLQAGAAVGQEYPCRHPRLDARTPAPVRRGVGAARRPPGFCRTAGADVETDAGMLLDFSPLVDMRFIFNRQCNSFRIALPIFVRANVMTKSSITIPCFGK